MSLQLRAVSEPMAIQRYWHDWDGPLQRGKLAFTRNRLTLSWHTGDWQFAYQQRYDYLLRFNDATAALYWHDRQRGALPQHAKVRLRAEHLWAQGVQLGYRWSSSGRWTLTPSITLLSGREFQSGQLHGDLTRSPSGLPQGQAQLRYRYSDDLLLDDPAAPGSGAGLALGLSATYQGAGWRLRAQLDDVGVMDWQQAPLTTGRFSVAGRQGGVALAPAFSGRRDRHRYRQRLQPYGQLQVRGQPRWRGPGWQLDTEHYAGRVWVRPALRFEGWWGTPQLGYEVRQQQWWLAAGSAGGGWQVALGSDRGDLDRARSLSLSLSLRQSL
ncbi:hypothetical protein [Isoalcanivorax beigongshangi]|uniref:Uncharacterized protein n=1 Tax=Isoalcanivorax beigongshangi TaxID=3238810 RepID=A0ABV4AH31_9GAMM